MCGVFFQSLLLVSGRPPTSRPPRVLTSATFTVTHGSWLTHTESWLASWRTHAPSHGSHGISPVRCLWQLQGHRKVIAGETQNVREEAPALATLGPPPKGTGKLPVSADRNLTQPGTVVSGSSLEEHLSAMLVLQDGLSAAQTPSPPPPHTPCKDTCVGRALMLLLTRS